MARMSIDDKFLRDPRITQLALDLGVSRWDAMGRLLAVFAVCYDLERDVVSPALIDHAADRPGFADAMFDVDLAVNTRRGLRIRGAGKRIEYLAPKREAGRQGGLKSGESRRKSAKQKLLTAGEADEAFLNPPDPVPDPVPEDQISLPRDPAVPSPAPTPQPAPPEAQIPDRASQPGPEDRRRARADLRTELELARTHVAAKLGETVNPLLAFDQGIDADLQGQLALATTWPAFDLVTTQARHAIAMAAAETASGEKSLEWFTGAIFQPKNFRRLAAKTATSRAGPRSSAARASTTGQPMIRPKYDEEAS